MHTSSIRYRSPWYVLLLAVLLAAIGWCLASPTSLHAQAATAPIVAPPISSTNDIAAADRTTPGAVVVFGLILQHIDFVTITVAVLSIVAVALIIQGFRENREAVLMPAATTAKLREMIGRRQFRELAQFTADDTSFVSRVLHPALRRMPSHAAMKEAVETALGEQTADQFRRLEYLNIIGNLGPLLGLLGTVLGLIESFDAMNRAGGVADPKELAGGISTALTHTFLGLFLAVPCLAAFGWLRTRVDRLTVRGGLLAEELLLALQSSADPAAPPVRPTSPGSDPRTSMDPLT